MTDMHIKIVDVSKPGVDGRWITVPLRSEHFHKFDKNVELYSPDIPEGYAPISFTRFPEMKW